MYRLSSSRTDMTKLFLGNLDFFLLSLVCCGVVYTYATHVSSRDNTTRLDTSPKKGLWSPYNWSVPIGADGTFTYNGTVYMEDYFSPIHVSPNNSIIWVIKNTSVIDNLTLVTFFVEGTVPKANLTTTNVTVNLHGDRIITSIVLRFFNDTPPLFPEPFYIVPSSVRTDPSVSLKNISVSTRRHSVIYHLSNRSIVTVENTTGHLYRTLNYTPPGTYHTLLYAGLLDHPDVQSYTAIVIRMTKQEASSITTTKTAVEEAHPVVPYSIGFPKHKMGCPAEDIPGSWKVEKGILLPIELDVTINNNNTLEMCGFKQPVYQLRGKYCLHKVKTAFCPEHFLNDSLTVRTTDSVDSIITVDYCCVNSGNENVSISFSADWHGPFYLFPYKRHCQSIAGFDVHLEYMKWDVNYSNVSGLTRQETTEYSGRTAIKLLVCSYTFHNFWPTGNFGLLKAEEPCIEGLFSATSLVDSAEYYQYGSFWLTDRDGKNDPMSSTADMCARNESVKRQGFPPGNYCVFGKKNTCPMNMEKSKINVLRYKSFSLFSLTYCCMRSDRDTTISLPTEHPFYLLQSGSDCQQVHKMNFVRLWLEFRSSNNSKLLISPADIVGVTTNGEETVRFSVCKYHAPNFDRDVGSTEAPNFDRDVGSTAAPNGGDGFGTAVGIMSIILALIPVIYCCRKRRRRQRARRLKEIDDQKLASISTTELTPKEKGSLEIGSMLKMVLDAESQMTIYGFLIHPDKIETLDKVGKGVFGTVYQGRYRPDENPLHVQDVAIKTLKENCAYPEISAFMEEAIVMADFRHANVLTMIGVCVHPITYIPTLVLPFMEHGDLQKYLRKFRYEDDLKDKTPELHQLLSFCLHIVRGMTYLSDMKFVHRDLAARNCMLDSNMVVKVADFGLTRDIYSNSYYRQDKNKLLPIKWMAVESLQDRVFSIYTDVWSYGVTAWEIFTLGKVPYPELENIQVLPELEKGHRLSKPDTCPDAVFDLVLSCWLENPKERPSFVDIAKTIEEALGGMSEYLDLDTAPAKTVDISSGVICSPLELASKETPSKMNYADYREASLRAKAQDETHNR